MNNLLDANVADTAHTFHLPFLFDKLIAVVYSRRDI